MRPPEELQTAIEELASAVERSALVRAARELSDRYQRGDGAGALPTDTHRLAYLQSRMPATFAANLHVLSEAHRGLPHITVESLLDMGAGPGTSMWAALQVFTGISRITLVERDRGLLDLGRKLAARSQVPAVAAAQWELADAAAFRPSPHDLVMISYVLGELKEPAAQRVIAAAWEAAGKLLVIIEPGTPRNFKRVLQARQMLIAAGAQIVAPCPHHNPCPLAEAGDWCHFAARVERTAEHRRMKGGTLGYEDEKFSYVVASRSQAEWPQARIVRHPLFRPGHVQLSLCTGDGLKHQTIGKSQKELYRAARKAEWGDSWPPMVPDTQP